MTETNAHLHTPLLLRHRGFLGLTLTQFFETLNDNTFKVFVTLWALDHSGWPENRVTALGGAMFVLPFLMFSALAGSLADRWSKRRVALWVKAAEVSIMVVASFFLRDAHLGPLLGLVFLLGLHSAFFAPAKYGLLPEILPPKDLSNGNGIVQSTTFLAIILGTPLGIALLHRVGDHPGAAGPLFVVLAVAGLLSSFLIDRVPPRRPPHAP